MTKAMAEIKNDRITRAEELLNGAKAEGRALTDDEASEIEQIRDQVLNIDKTAELEEQIREFEKHEKKGDEEHMNDEIKTRELQERKAFENYIRGTNNRGEDVNLSPASSSAGALIPKTILDYVINKVYDICPILARSQRFNVKGKLAIPYYPATAANITVAYQDEFVDMDSTSGKFETVELGGFLAGALTKVSRSLINNLNFDIVGYVADRMAYEIARFVEGELLKGTAGKVTGLSTLQHSVQTASATAITAADLVKLQGSIKDQFQPNACWIMNPKTRTDLFSLQTGENRFLFQFDPANGFRPMILGKPVFVSDNMPTIDDGGDVIFYGDMNGLATKFAEEASIEVLRERYAPQHAIGVVGWIEFDAKVIDEQQIAKLSMGVSST